MSGVMAFLRAMDGIDKEKQTLDSMRTRAYADSKEAFPDQRHSYSQRDAMRHGLIAGQMAQRYGELPARALGYGFEALSPHNWRRPDVPDLMMDFHNDDVGATLGARIPSYEGLRAAMQGMATQARKREMRGFGDYLGQPNDEMVYLQNDGSRKP